MLLLLLLLLLVAGEREGDSSVEVALCKEGLVVVKELRCLELFRSSVVVVGVCVCVKELRRFELFRDSVPTLSSMISSPWIRKEAGAEE